MSVKPDNFFTSVICKNTIKNRIFKENAIPATVILSVLAGTLVCAAYIPYAADIIKGKAVPARSARIMLTALIVIALFQQAGLSAGWAMAVTAGETVGSLAILILALKKGVGGFSTTDKLCYILLVADLALWLTTKHTLWALHLTILADTIAFYPTVIKTWRDPKSETPLFYIAGTITPILNMLAVGSYGYEIIVFPLYLALANGLEVVLIYIRPSVSNDVILTK